MFKVKTLLFLLPLAIPAQGDVRTRTFEPPYFTEIGYLAATGPHGDPEPYFVSGGFSLTDTFNEPSAVILSFRSFCYSDNWGWERAWLEILPGPLIRPISAGTHAFSETRHVPAGTFTFEFNLYAEGEIVAPGHPRGPTVDLWLDSMTVLPTPEPSAWILLLTGAIIAYRLAGRRSQPA